MGDPGGMAGPGGAGGSNEIKIRISADNQASGKLGEVEQALKGMISQFVGIGAAYKFVEFTKDAVNGLMSMASEMTRLTAITGINVTELQKLKGVAELTDTNFSSLTNGFKFLGKSMMDAATGNKDLKAIFGALKVDFESAPGVLRPVNDVMMDLADVFKNMPEGPTRTTLAIKLLGKAGQDMVPYLAQGRKELKDLGDQVVKTGVIVDEYGVKAAKRLEDQQKLLGMQVRGLKNDFAVELMPALQDTVTLFSWLEKHGAGLGTIMADMLAQGGQLGGNYALRAKLLKEVTLAQTKMTEETKKYLQVGIPENALLGKQDDTLARLLASMAAVNKEKEDFTDTPLLKDLTPAELEKVRAGMYALTPVMKGITRDASQLTESIVKIGTLPPLKIVDQETTDLIQRANTAASLLSGTVTGTLEAVLAGEDVFKSFAKVAINAIKRLVMEMIEAAIRAAILRAILGVASGGVMSPLGLILGGASSQGAGMNNFMPPGGGAMIENLNMEINMGSTGNSLQSGRALAYEVFRALPEAYREAKRRKQI